MENKVVSNTGPILHLTEIDLIKALNVFHNVLIPEEVLNELKKSKILVPKKIKIISLKSRWKDTVKILVNQHNLDLGESEAISLVLQEKAEIFLTDDLEARNIAKSYNIATHGTIGIILRAFREKLIDKRTAIKKVNELYVKSSLFITKDLVNQVVKAINEFSS